MSDEHDTRRLARAEFLVLLLVLGLLSLVPAAALGNRSLSSEKAVNLESVPGGVIEGPCGIALSSSGGQYVSSYYAGAVDVFGSSGGFLSSLPAGVAPEGPCQLATSTTGALYANRWHEGVSRLLPTSLSFDEAESTGVAVDASGRVYADDRTYVAAYEPSGEPVGGKATPLLLGAGSLGDAYGLAAFGGKVYLADAASNTVKVFEADGEPAGPVDEIDGASTPPGHFISLVDASLAIDPSNGHLLVMDNLQPGFTHPQGAIYEFDASGAYLGRLPGTVIDGGPSGMAVTPGGLLFVSSGNSEEGTVFRYSTYAAGGLLAPGGGGSGAAMSRGEETPPESRAQDHASTLEQGPLASASETIQRGHVRVGVNALLSPKKLPRRGSAPVRFSLDAKISATKGSVPPQLQKIEIEINRHGRIEPKGLPRCEVSQIQPATTEAALAACRSSLVGTGRFRAKVLISQQAPFPSDGKIYAFNGTYKGRPAILAHVYGTKPIPTSATIPFVIGKAKGTYGTRLTASLPQVTSQWGYVTGISMNLGKSFVSHGKGRSYLSAGCPAPKGFPGASFPLSRTNFVFDGGSKVGSVLNRSCLAR